jgi:hypothetical protein
VVFGVRDEEVGSTTDRAETHECEGDGVSPDVLGGIAGQEGECSDDSTTVTEGILEGGANATPQVSADCWKGTRMSDDRTGRMLEVGSPLALNQQTRTGVAAA